MTDENETPVQIEKALEEFDLSEWLSGVTSPKDTITIYRDGETVRLLNLLVQRAEEMEQQSKEEKRQLLSLGDEDEEFQLDAEVREQIEALREKLKPSGLTFEVAGISPTETRLIQKKIERQFKDKKDADGNSGSDHEDFGFALDTAYIVRCVKGVFTPDGRKVMDGISKEQVESLRFNEETGQGLPLSEFARLSGKVVSVVYMRYDMEKLIDQDFS